MSPSRPKISLIFPVYNQKSLLLRALSTLRDVTGYPNFEVILVDDRSTEDMSEVYENKDFYDRLIVLSEHSGNSTVAVNEGIKNSSGEFIQYQNTDVYFEAPDWLDILVDAFDEDTGVVGPALLYPDRTIQCAGMFFDRKGLNHNLYNYRLYDTVEKRTINVPMVTGCGLTTRRELLESAGGFTVFQPHGWDDVDWCLHMAEQGRKVKLCLNSYFYHLGTVSYSGMDTPRYHNNRRRIHRRYKNVLRAVSQYRPDRKKYIFFLKDLDETRENKELLSIISRDRLDKEAELLIFPAGMGKLQPEFRKCGARILPPFFNAGGSNGISHRLTNIRRCLSFLQVEKPDAVVYDSACFRTISFIDHLRVLLSDAPAFLPLSSIHELGESQHEKLS